MEVDKIVCAEVLDFLQTLPDNSVHCVVTSPPYYGLRDYGTGQWEGGDPHCEHVVGNQVADNKAPGAITSGVRPGADASSCRKCGASRIDRQIGLEQTPQEYIAKLITVFNEVRRVLRKDGVLWLNVGDSYWGGKGQSGSGGVEFQQLRVASGVSFSSPAAHVGGHGKTRPTDRRSATFKSKDLMMMPARLAIALQESGWWLRSECVWSKPNGLPESIEDRPTRSHEMVYLLTKSARYFYDQTAIREPQTGAAHSRGNGSSPKEKPGHDDRCKSNHSFNTSMTAYVDVPGGRNKRTVWTVPTESNGFAHFATFPRKLIEPMILAGCPRWVCAVCGAPYVRVLERKTMKIRRTHRFDDVGKHSRTATSGTMLEAPQSRTIGWKPTCACAELFCDHCGSW